MFTLWLIALFLEFALENGIHVNVDNYQELERITAIINDQG